MKLVKLTAAAALVAASFGASAMTAINDQDLSAVSGQDGVSIAGNLNINIGSFTYTDTDGAGGALATAAPGSGSVSFNNISVTGLFLMNIDVVSGAQFQTLLAADSVAGGTAISMGASYGGQDVVQFAFPADATLDSTQLVDIKVGGITTGKGTSTAATQPSFGSMEIKGLDMRGTTVWMWAH